MNPIVCVTGVELLMEYLEGTLPAEVRAALDEHVAGCARCTAFVASYCETPRILREATLRTFPADLQQSLRAALRAHRRARPQDE